METIVDIKKTRQSKFSANYFPFNLSSLNSFFIDKINIYNDQTADNPLFINFSIMCLGGNGIGVSIFIYVIQINSRLKAITTSL